MAVLIDVLGNDADANGVMSPSMGRRNMAQPSCKAADPLHPQLWFHRPRQPTYIVSDGKGDCTLQR
ncbi:MAG: hypothetical protein R2932_44445 [Caldilineaceae bacterium]